MTDHDQQAPPITAQDQTLCAVCAWRADCQKQYSRPAGGALKCPDYARDMTLPPKDKRSS